MAPWTETPLPAGSYYVGDVCYVVSDATWAALAQSATDANSWRATVNHHTCWMAWTACGDGCYVDNEGRQYGVDSGTMGLIPVEACDQGKLAHTLEAQLGHVVTFAMPVLPQAPQAGVVWCGHLVIDTRGQKTDDGTEACEH